MLGPANAFPGRKNGSSKDAVRTPAKTMGVKRAYVDPYGQGYKVGKGNNDELSSKAASSRKSSLNPFPVIVRYYLTSKILVR